MIFVVRSVGSRKEEILNEKELSARYGLQVSLKLFEMNIVTSVILYDDIGNIKCTIHKKER